MATVGSSSIHVAHRRTSSSAHDLRLAKCIGECLRGPTIPSLLMESDVPLCRPRFPHRTPPPPPPPLRCGPVPFGRTLLNHPAGGWQATISISFRQRQPPDSNGGTSSRLAEEERAAECRIRFRRLLTTAEWGRVGLRGDGVGNFQITRRPIGLTALIESPALAP